MVAVLRLINRVRSLLIHDIQERKTNSFRKNSIGTHKQSSKITKSRENTLITKNWRNRPIGDQRTARYGSVRTLLIFMTGYFSSNKNFGPLILGKKGLGGYQEAIFDHFQEIIMVLIFLLWS